MIKSAFQNHFAQIPSVQKPRSEFKRVSRHKHTFDEGYLIPFYLDDVLPGDTFNVKASMFARLATPIFPIMDNMYLETFWFFVPNRIVWENFPKQHGEQQNPGDSTDYTTPVINLTDPPTVGSLWDNFGLPLLNYDKIEPVSALPFRAYNLIWNEWFRDQDYQDSKAVDKGDTTDNQPGSRLPWRINKFKDYFTTARPSPQKGPAIEIPPGQEAPVVTTGQTPTVGPLAGPFYNMAIVPTTSALSAFGYAPSTPVMSQWGNTTGLKTNLSAGVGPTVNEWREAIVIQQAYELDMRGGSRYIEMIFNHYGVINPDFRLQRPEFLGYSKSMVNIHPVTQTSESATTPQGNLSAFGTVSSSGNGFVKSFTEFGYVIGLIAVRSDISYQENVDRHWSRQTRFDYYYPNFANLGEQAILRQELQAQPNLANNQEVAGYQERWAEYRFKTSKITGLFRSSVPASLDAWHLAQELSSAVINEFFIEENAPLDRVIAVPGEPHFIFDCLVENSAARVMPMYSAPGLTRL